MIALFQKYTMYIFVLMGLLAGIPAVWIFRDRAKLRLPGVIIVCVLYSVCSVIAAMLFAHLESLISAGRAANSGAISTYGIYFFGSLMLLLISKVCRMNAAGILDIFALYAMPSFFMLRLNCLRAGCCGGTLIPGTSLAWPTRETELIFYAVMFVVFWRMLKKNEIPGQLFPLLMAAYGTFRFVNQWFRDDGVDGLHMSHGWSILCALVGFTLFFEIRAQAAAKRKKTRQKNKHGP